MKKKKEIKIQLTELFMAKAGKKDFSRCFHGTIVRGTDDEGNPVVHSKICVKNKIHNGYIYAMAKDQWELGEKLDDLVLMILDYGLHSHAGRSESYLGTDLFLN